MDKTPNNLQYNKGEIVTGTVLKMTDKGAIVSIGSMTNGFVPKDQLSSVYKEGDAILVLITDKVGDDKMPIFSNNVANYFVENDEDIENIRVGREINVVFDYANSAGLHGKYKTMQCFLPTSQIFDTEKKDIKSLLKTPLEVIVLQINYIKNTIVVSKKYKK